VKRFDPDEFVAACVEAVGTPTDAAGAVRELLAHAVDDPTALARVLPEATSGPMMQRWFCSDDLTVLHIVWPPGVELAAHDHDMFAAIGIYGGREDNSFFRRNAGGTLQRSGGRTLLAGDTAVLGRRAVHAVTNPTRDWTAAIHVYGGNFFTADRTTWSDLDAPGEPLDASTISTHLEEAAGVARRADLRSSAARRRRRSV